MATTRTLVLTQALPAVGLGGLMHVSNRHPLPPNNTLLELPRTPGVTTSHYWSILDGRKT